jgi:hypothetical protein
MRAAGGDQRRDHGVIVGVFDTQKLSGLGKRQRLAGRRHQRDGGHKILRDARVTNRGIDIARVRG